MSESAQGASEVFGRLADAVLSGSVADVVALYAPDVVIEMPFGLDGVPFRSVGAEPLRERMTRGLGQRRYTRIDEVVVHETPDPDKIIAEYRIHGETDGTQFSRRFVMVIWTRDGKIVLSRDYSGPSVS
jgi:ketosteroid isomerase-like protein